MGIVSIGGGWTFACTRHIKVCLCVYLPIQPNIHHKYSVSRTNGNDISNAMGSTRDQILNFTGKIKSLRPPEDIYLLCACAQLVAVASTHSKVEKNNAPEMSEPWTGINRFSINKNEEKKMEDYFIASFSLAAMVMAYVVHRCTMYGLSYSILLCLLQSFLVHTRIHQNDLFNHISLLLLLLMLSALCTYTPR